MTAKGGPADRAGLVLGGKPMPNDAIAAHKFDHAVTSNEKAARRDSNGALDRPRWPAWRYI